MRYLRNSAEIREQLTALFAGPGRKWAVVGFVGYDALDFLPANVANLRVVCWPKAGGTNPDGVRRLLDAKIPVFFCDRLHQKIYWRESAGLIVGSANLSNNALGDDRLHEFAVFCDDPAFDIERVLEKLRYAPVTPEQLARLDLEHDRDVRQRGPVEGVGSAHAKTFLQSLQTRYPKRWKLVTFEERRTASAEIAAEVEANFGTTRWVNDNDVEPGKYDVGDFVLQVKTNDDGVITRANATWLFVDHVIRKDGVSAIVQVRPLDASTPPPFVIDRALDPDFKPHFKRAFNEQGDWDDVFDAHCVPRPSFLAAIARQYGPA
ncbi:hypothetical protein E4K72_07930 [Oxalobacteraceae bacterium OM1]|nr:hypothetical protein E4K72_07930 [Oxalobacteraceae bacterium OM1]